MPTELQKLAVLSTGKSVVKTAIRWQMTHLVIAKVVSWPMAEGTTNYK